MKKSFCFVLMLSVMAARAQELYPFAEPASNNPANSLSIKVASMFQKEEGTNRTQQRYMPEVRLGLNKDLMLNAGVMFSDMHRPAVGWEAAKLYAKWRFHSDDGVHEHFRLAAFGAATYSRNRLNYNEINLMMGEQSGVQVGAIATQLWNKLAVSATGSWNEVLDADRDKRDLYAVRAVNYSLSAGYLLLPFEYKDYNQTNINLYAELLGGRNIGFDRERYWVDLAPSVQAIFGSAAKLNVGYRFELGSDIIRMGRKSWMVSFEYLFLNALKR